MSDRLRGASERVAQDCTDIVRRPNVEHVADAHNAALAELRAVLADEQHRADTQSTHSGECYKWHHKCAVRAVERLTAERDAALKRVPLTEEQLVALWDSAAALSRYPDRPAMPMFARAIENAHGIGGSDE